MNEQIVIDPRGQAVVLPYEYDEPHIIRGTE